MHLRACVCEGFIDDESLIESRGGANACACLRLPFIRHDLGTVSVPTTTTTTAFATFAAAAAFLLVLAHPILYSKGCGV